MIDRTTDVEFFAPIANPARPTCCANPLYFGSPSKHLFRDYLSALVGQVALKHKQICIASSRLRQSKVNDLQFFWPWLHLFLSQRFNRTHSILCSIYGNEMRMLPMDYCASNPSLTMPASGFSGELVWHCPLSACHILSPNLSSQPRLRSSEGQFPNLFPPCIGASAEGQRHISRKAWGARW